MTWRQIACGGAATFSALLILVTFLPAWHTDRWWVRMWDYPRLQVAGLMLVALVGLFLVWPRYGNGFWALIILTIAAFGWQVSHFIAYLPLYPREIESAKSCAPERAISLLNANVLMGNRDYQSLIRLIDQRQPDLVMLLEGSKDWEEALDRLDDKYPFRLSEPVPNTYGMILLSRLPMEGEIRHLLQPAVPSAHVKIRLEDGQVIDFYGLHPEPPLPGDDSGERDAELMQIGKKVRTAGRAAIVMGDLNDVAWSHTSRLFKKASGMGDPRVGRGFYPTFNAKHPLMRWPLDHLFVSPHFVLMEIDVLPSIGSDHFPIFFRLCLKDPADVRKVAPSAPASVEAEANEEVRAGKSERNQEDAE